MSHWHIHLTESQFKKVKKVCLETEKLLLLSATPPVGNEKEYLKMMHLIVQKILIWKKKHLLN